MATADVRVVNCDVDGQQARREIDSLSMLDFLHPERYHGCFEYSRSEKWCTGNETLADFTPSKVYGTGGILYSNDRFKCCGPA